MAYSVNLPFEVGTKMPLYDLLEYIPSYDKNTYLPQRGISLIKEGIKPIPTILGQSTVVEKIGNAFLYIPENIPHVVKTICTNPQVIAAGAFAVGHFINCYGWYPNKTLELIKIPIEAILPYLTIEIVKEATKATAWLSISEVWTGLCLRAGGRLSPSYIEKLTSSQIENNNGLDNNTNSNPHKKDKRT